MNRRTILKNAGVGFAATAGVAGTASADSPDVDELPRIDPETVRSALGDEQALLEELAADGVIETPSADELDFQPSAADEDVVVADHSADGERERLLSHAAPVEDGELVVGVDPDDGAAFAIHVRDGDRTIYGPMEMSGCYCSDPCCCIPVCACCCQWTCGLA